MSTFIGELAKKLAEKWMTLLVLPGLLLLATAACGYLLRNRRWNDLTALTSLLSDRTQTVAGRGNVTVALAVAAVLLAAAAAGFAANGTGWAISHIWLSHRLTWLGKPLTWWRRQRWIAAEQAALGTTASPTAPASVMRLLYRWNQVLPNDPAVRRNRICLAPPQRPTWIGDRVAATGTRVENQYGLDLASTWPRLWPLLPDAIRTDITTARAAFDQTTTLGGWAVLYTVVGAWTGWWPAVAVGIGTFVAAWYRARSAIADLTDLVESAIDLYATTLADALGIPTIDGHVHRHTGRQITARIRKGT
ncbi:hypothetical protein GPX89_34605 [Nocardia sp. ET3-3]|uniref:Vegetative cell wall protein gp1 n=1 Tax=Nocardia terrae TaxID=2675851 RepID=A0A7K1V7C1_9NOCA|nr:hypothetical protein [Nocardia terrae]MVU82352.1 hypothetical protein [Nocardia terrae]